MHRKIRAFRPGATSLEPKLLLSLAPIVQVAAAKPSNRVSGRYFAPEDMRAADAPLDLTVSGAGNVQGLGRSTLSGSIRFGGFLMPGQPDITGTVTLTNAKGSVSIRLVGSGGNGQVPGKTFHLTASVVSGTGAYKNFRRIGTVTAHLGPNTVQAIKAPSPIGGTLGLTFQLKPPVR